MDGPPAGRYPSQKDGRTVRASYQNNVWFGLWAPKQTPPDVVQKLHREIVKAVATPSVKAQIVRDAGVPMQTPLAEIEPLVKADIAKWADVVKRANIQVQ
ncbi:MAG TPA: tripartite tricarboxylate transporter substrate-binding protein [Pseudolabrys sp.]|nr:tripartite tricarboxylate transporter substrate-binding protein [Pseudolabrys sp.]